MRRTIRFRITAAAVLLSGVLLVGVALVMVAVVRSQLTDNLDESINQRADTLESVLSSGLPPQVPGDEDLLVQVVDADGRSLASSANLVGKPPITSLTPGHRTVHSVPGRTEVFRVLVRRVTSQGRPALLIVGTNYDHVTEPVSILSRFLAIAVPCVVFALGVLTRWLTGRTLRPVERMRLDMAEITGTSLDRRVQEPKTGDEIDRLAHTMNATLDRLEDAIRRQQRFVADASTSCAALSPESAANSKSTSPRHNRTSPQRHNKACSKKRSACSISSTICSTWPAATTPRRRCAQSASTSTTSSSAKHGACENADA